MDIQVRIGTATGRTTKIYDDSVTPMTILNENDVELNGATITANGIQLTFEELNKPLSDLGIKDSVSLSATIKTGNA